MSDYEFSQRLLAKNYYFINPNGVPYGGSAGREHFIKINGGLINVINKCNELQLLPELCNLLGQNSKSVLFEPIGNNPSLKTVAYKIKPILFNIIPQEAITFNR